MGSVKVPSYEEWVEYCFVQGHRDFLRWSTPGLTAADARDSFCEEIPDGVVAEYIARLFESPGFLIERYTPDQIAGATWFLFGIASEYFKSIRGSDAVDTEMVVRVYRAVPTMYHEVYDRICCKMGTTPDENCHDEIDGAVYTIWDMDCIEAPVCFPDAEPSIARAGFDALERILFECRTYSCRISAIRGLAYGCRKGFGPARSIVNRFLYEHELAENVRETVVGFRDGRWLG